ncbi:alpha/beta-hydrolase [Fomitiporia mediterranea MF3/22]|uniref:alpha/beta-hydrolase n=1 Tax=Fomitiporia mediterranea (strain MF3/22) TaxID=694068 RepID=UPI0004409AE1|nr:alpha/beta-hydrolase [Fomitiporia mediterranea MF3/22]EJC99947.1 alpha/beta-hydrolase [Fomitiporia mediterranea MF3/22]
MPTSKWFILIQSCFPVYNSIQVHDGFADSHARVAPDILSAVQTTLSAHPDASVTMIGHSLGAAQALLDSIFLPLHLHSGTKYKFVGYGLPRVGNQAFADYVDSHVTDLTHVTNRKDPIPIIPGRFLGFQHPQGEIHIQESGEWKACPDGHYPFLAACVL